MMDRRFPLTELGELPGNLRERVGEIARKSGFVPDIFRALGLALALTRTPERFGD
jgi:hypothetical protein